MESELGVAQAPLREALALQAELSRKLEVGEGDADKLLEQMAQLSDRIEQLGGWDTEHHAKTLLDRLGVKDWDRPVAELSGGLRKRVSIARRCSPGQISCCWTSPPTTWTRTPPSGSRTSWTSSPARCCWSPTIATSSTGSWTASWRSTPARA